jgi:uncharacterized protein YhdP
MSEVFSILAGRGLVVLESNRLRVVLITLAILIVLAAFGFELVSVVHPHVTAPLADGQTWVEQ